VIFSILKINLIERRLFINKQIFLQLAQQIKVVLVFSNPSVKLGGGEDGFTTTGSGVLGDWWIEFYLGLDHRGVERAIPAL